MVDRQCEHMETHISVCNGLIGLKLQEVYSNRYINWLRQFVKLDNTLFYNSIIIYFLSDLKNVCLMGA